MSHLWSSENRSRILLVSDEDQIRNPVYTLLENEGYEVLTATNTADGITTFRRSIYPIELLITDFNIVTLSGLELAHECTRLDRDLSVLYVSTSELNEDLRMGILGRKRGFLLKPFDGNDLRRKVKELLLTETTLQPAGAAKPESFRGTSVFGLNTLSIPVRSAVLRIPFVSPTKVSTPEQPPD
jgi:DNA-binding response OmpR family regulator